MLDPQQVWSCRLQLPAALQLPKLGNRRRAPRRRRPIIVVLPASATACNVAANSNLIFLPDSLSGKNFLADSGASLSILPHTSNSCPSGPKLRSVNGASISAWGFKTIPLKIGRFRFVHRFLLADVANPILGIDFFKQHGLLISPPTHQVIFSGSGVSLWPAQQVHDTPQPPPPRPGSPLDVSGQPAQQVSFAPPPPPPSWSANAAAVSRVSQVTPPVPAPPPPLPLSSGKHDPRVTKLLQDFPEIFCQSVGRRGPPTALSTSLKPQVGQCLPSPAAWIRTS